jgi:Bacterial regulatory helix-turn-helix protein, lysR family
MITERMTVETAEARLSRRFGSPAPGQLRALAKGETQKCQNYAKSETVGFRMIDLNLFRVFDAMMLHRSVRKASQMLSVTPSAVSHALSRLRQSIGDELFIPTESGMQPTRRALELAPAVRAGLGELELALTGKESAPTKTLWTFPIGAGE